MDSNSPDKSKIPDSLADRITKTLIYGKERKSETDLKIGEIKKDLSDFAEQVRNKIKQKRNDTKKETNSRKVKKLKTRENNNNSPCGGNKRFRG